METVSCGVQLRIWQKISHLDEEQVRMQFLLPGSFVSDTCRSGIVYQRVVLVPNGLNRLHTVGGAGRTN
eukprot:scaffold5889_cov115-Cylindrotheca_fusiformis.AAC.2